MRSWAALSMDNIRVVGKLLIALRLKSALANYGTIYLYFTLFGFF